MTQNRILTLGDEDFGLEIWTIGARLNDLRIGGRGGLLARCETAEEALGARKNHGAVVGPVANRLARAEAPVKDVVHRLVPNENGRTICHSGARGVNTKTWEVATETEDTLVLSLDIDDGADDLPGNRTLTVRYRLTRDGFEVVFEAATDAPTLMNLALHPYWSLNRTGREGQTVEVNADRYLPIDEDKIPTGEIAPVDGTIFDLRVARIPSHEIDHNFCLSGGPAVRLAADNGLVLEIETDAPGLQLYAGSPVGLAIEPQHWPDAPHHDAFPSILLEPGETYRQVSTYRFSRS